MTRYPLHTLEQLRGRTRDAAASELAERGRATRARQAAVETVQVNQRELVAQRKRRHGSEQTRAAAEGARAEDFQRLGAYDLSVRQELQALARTEQNEQHKLQAARADERQARSKLGQSEAEHRAVVRHREQFEAAEQAKAERLAEEDAELVHAARRRS
jgi:hypothetical protein